MIKRWQMAIKFRITIEESPGVIQKLLVTGFETKTGISASRRASSTSHVFVLRSSRLLTV
jgi:hypothetical protein